ncbi:hypothetical protein BU16DRAFT_468665 [Lophium mytilinum]|uniref:Thioesterase/thiol ester dehydrase-isomerase n=1 Tax=Lophium mytilinum TaxID=390894 RepID=A0A6A6QJM3_9PEZI|nr:hypothetical protein BU16DRAFT_468665 [Lophium mytilinum]
MPSLHRLPQVVSLTGLGSFLVALVTQPALRSYVSRTLGLNAPGGAWRAFAIFMVLANIKNFPLMWHWRFFRSYFAHLYFPAPKLTPQSLFEPSIMSTYSPITETDFNLHKSNSTYFSDFDISRTHLVSQIIRTGFRKSVAQRHSTFPPSAAELATKGKDFFALGAVSCHFKREIKPYEKFEIWTRVLCWDQKWLYMVSHMVKPGVARPKHYTLQPGRRGYGSEKREQNGALGNGEAKEEEQKRMEKLRGAVFASSIAKYVTKKGRLTIPPEVVLLRSEMLPPKPEGWIYNGEEGSDESNGTVLDDAILPEDNDNKEWNWDTIEAERRRGLKFAEMFGQLDGLHDEFDGGKNGVLGKFADILW